MSLYRAENEGVNSRAGYHLAGHLGRNVSPDEQPPRVPCVAERSAAEAESIEANSTAVSGLERSDSPDEQAAPRSVVRDEWPVLAVEILRRKPTKIVSDLERSDITYDALTSSGPGRTAPNFSMASFSEASPSNPLAEVPSSAAS